MTLLLLIPLLGALVAAMAPSDRIARWSGLAFQAWALVYTLGLALDYDAAAGGLQFVERLPWIPAFGIDYHVGADGLSIVLLLLTAIVSPFAVLTGVRAKWQVVMVLLLQTTLVGTFVAVNLILWFLFYELSLAPAFLLARSSGTPRAAAASFRFFVYTFLGGMGILAGFLAIQAATGTFDLQMLAAGGGLVEVALEAGFGWPFAGTLVFACIFLGLSVKVPVVPMHAWLPDAYAESPSAVTMLLTGLMSKMGVYGFLRLLVPLFPGHMAALAPALLALALVTIVFSAFTALVQTDLKRMLAWSSVNHLGYCLLGIFAAAAANGTDAAQTSATNGVILQIFNHGLTASALFAFVAFIEKRSGGARGIGDFGGLRTAAPVLAGLMGIAVFSSLGLPGLNGFVGEFLIFAGTFQIAPWAAAAATAGLFATAVFLLNMIQRVFAGPLGGHSAGFRDLTAGEIATVAPLVGLMFVLGIYPQVLIALFHSP